MNVAPQMNAQNNDALLHPLERINIFTRIQNVLGIQDYSVPDTSRECLKSVTPNFVSNWRTRISSFFNGNSAEALPTAA